jgi:hypothetical protein
MRPGVRSRPFLYPSFTKYLQRLPGKCSSGVMVAYALHHGEQEIPSDLSDDEWRCISPAPQDEDAPGFTAYERS